MATENDTISSVSLKAIDGAIKVEYFRMAGIKVHLTINVENNRIGKLPIKEKAMEYINKGFSNVETAKRVNMSEGTIRKWKKENGM